MFIKQKGVTVWFTGLSGAGKTTVAGEVERELRERNYRVVLLDGDDMRRTIARDLGFSRQDREENMRRIGFMAYFLTRFNFIALVSAISPYRTMRGQLRDLLEDFIEVYVNAPLEVCEKRDVKGLYSLARLGKINQFTGIDSQYEAPLNPEVECLTHRESVAECVKKVLDELGSQGYIELSGAPGVSVGGKIVNA